jgi:hypothetical protein
MTDDIENRDRVANCALAVDSLQRYGGGFRELERVDRDLKQIVFALESFADPAWTHRLIGLWGRLEITYASALCHQRCELRPGEVIDMREVEFVSDDAVKLLMFTVPGEDLEVVWHPGYGPLSLKARGSP